MTARPRLYLDHPLAPGQTLPLTADQANYLFNVLRLGPGAGLTVLNGRDGAFDAVVTDAAKRRGAVTVGPQTAPLQAPPDLWLCFAPIVKARTDFIVEKAAELGAARIQPVLTDFTQSGSVNVERLQAHAIEAAEQCGGTFVPTVAAPVRLPALLDRWDAARALVFCDEALVGRPASPLPPAPAAILIGPQGGFSDAERTRLRALPFAHPVSLGPRILRADTAAVAALTLWQSARGDW